MNPQDLKYSLLNFESTDSFKNIECCCNRKSSKIEHIKANIDILDFELTESEMKDNSNLSEGKRLIDPDFTSEWDEESSKNR